MMSQGPRAQAQTRRFGFNPVQHGFMPRLQKPLRVTVARDEFRGSVIVPGWRPPGSFQRETGGLDITFSDTRLPLDNLVHRT